MDEEDIIVNDIPKSTETKAPKVEPLSWTPFFVSVAVWIGVAVIVGGAYAAVRRNGLFCNTGNTTWQNSIMAAVVDNHPCANPSAIARGRSPDYYRMEASGIPDYTVVAIPINGVMTLFIGRNGKFDGTRSTNSCPLNWTGRIFDDGSPCTGERYSYNTECSDPDVADLGPIIGRNIVYLPQVPWNASIEGMRASVISGPSGVPPVVTINNVTYISECRFPLFSPDNIGIGLSGIGTFAIGENGGNVIGAVLKTRTEALAAAQVWCDTTFTNSPELQALITSN